MSGSRRQVKQKRLADGEPLIEIREPDKTKIKDYATGKLLKDTPEERVRQIFERRLVEEYGYTKDQIDINFLIQKGSLKIGPADIVIFRNKTKIFDNIYIIIETKRKDRLDGIDQLKTYLSPTSAEGGVWFNGNEILYLRVKRKPPSYVPKFINWRNIPKKSEKWEEIGKHKEGSELTPAPNLQSIFKIIYYHLYTNSNLPRAERLGAEMTRIIFCKIYDELHCSNDLLFKAGADESDHDVAVRIKRLFEKVKGPEYGDVFEPDEKLLLDDRSIAYVVSQLQDISLLRTDKDAVGDAFEVFIGPGLRGEKGEFFTPRNVVRMSVEMLDLDRQEKIIDPSCGSGGFLIVALENVWKKMDEKYKHLPPEKRGALKAEIASKNFFGIDKEFDLAKVTKAYMAIIGDGRGGIFCADSLISYKEWNPVMQEKIRPNTFDVVLTNPPFGAKIPITSKKLLQNYELGFRWKRDKKTGKWSRTNNARDKQVPQILFIERCLGLLRPGGRMAIVLPDGIFGNLTDGFVREFIRQQAIILAVVDCPIETFLPSVGTKTSVLFLQKKVELEKTFEYPIFMAIAKKCGNDRRGNPIFIVNEKGEKILDDDFPKIAKEYQKFREKHNVNF